MLNPKTEEIVKLLRGCVLGRETLCDTCVCTGNTPYSCEKELVLIAADRLEELEAKLPRWIPVTERLPEKDGSYLVSRKHKSGFRTQDVIKFAQNGDLIDPYDLHGEKNVWYYYDSEYGHIPARNVTHWMPLPEPPKEV